MLLRALCATLALACFVLSPSPASADDRFGYGRAPDVSSQRAPRSRSYKPRKRYARKSARKARGAVSRQRVVRQRPHRASARRAPARKPVRQSAAFAPVEAVASAIRRPVRFIAGRLTCAVNVNAALAERGIRGTGSALAKSFLRWGRASAPVPGAVAVYHRGGRRSISGHVAIVAAVRGGRVYVWNPSRRGWRLQAYRRPAIAYRVAG